MRYNYKKAFSLLEVLGVLLIVGIIISSILGSKKIVSISRLSSARNLSSLSPVESIEGLTFWLDATAQDAFDDGADEDGTLISNWYDLNQQSLEKHHVSASAPNQPEYHEEAINGLPALNFDDTDDYLTGGSVIELTGNTGVTLFAVVNTVDDGNQQKVIQFGPTSSAQGKMLSFALDASFKFGDGNQFFSSQRGAPVIVTYRRSQGGSYDGGEMWSNGSSLSETSSHQPTLVPDIDPVELMVGAGRASSGSINAGTVINGYIGEIIVFNRSLTDNEREDVETYLSKKWQIDLN